MSAEPNALEINGRTYLSSTNGKAPGQCHALRTTCAAVPTPRGEPGETPPRARCSRRGARSWSHESRFGQPCSHVVGFRLIERELRRCRRPVLDDSPQL